jgi:hypothetical protein
MLSRVVIREARYVERLAYTRSQAAQALGISRSTLRRLLPYLETIEMPWGGKLIPVDELGRLAAEWRRTARPRLEPATRGRKPAVPPEIAMRIQHERSAGKSLRQIAANLNADRIPTAHGRCTMVGVHCPSRPSNERVWRSSVGEARRHGLGLG